MPKSDREIVAEVFENWKRTTGVTSLVFEAIRVMVDKSLLFCGNQATVHGMADALEALSKAALSLRKDMLEALGTAKQGE